MTHKFKALRGEYALALCGREVRRNSTTLSMREVNCSKCQAAFAKHLKSLSDVFQQPLKDEATQMTTKNRAAVTLGTLGGRATSPAKAAASRANGKKGGRPKEPADRCERCGKRHVEDWVWLELNQSTGHFATPGRVPPGDSQGLFRFGKTCADRALAHERQT